MALSPPENVLLRNISKGMAVIAVEPVETIMILDRWESRFFRIRKKSDLNFNNTARAVPI